MVVERQHGSNLRSLGRTQPVQAGTSHGINVVYSDSDAPTRSRAYWKMVSRRCMSNMSCFHVILTTTFAMYPTWRMTDIRMMVYES